jgi:transcriptional regulator with XRE-family HTH domain
MDRRGREPDTPRRVAFGQHIRSLRQRQGITQEGLALAADLDRSYMGGVERGERNVSLDNILRIADALRLPPAELFEAPQLRRRRRN